MSTADRVGTAIVFKDKINVQAVLEGSSNALVPKTFTPTWEQEVRLLIVC